MALKACITKIEREEIRDRVPVLRVRGQPWSQPQESESTAKPTAKTKDFLFIFNF